MYLLKRRIFTHFFLSFHATHSEPFWLPCLSGPVWRPCVLHISICVKKMRHRSVSTYTKFALSGPTPSYSCIWLPCTFFQDNLPQCAAPLPCSPLSSTVRKNILTRILQKSEEYFNDLSLEAKNIPTISLKAKNIATFSLKAKNISIISPEAKYISAIEEATRP